MKLWLLALFLPSVAPAPWRVNENHTLLWGDEPYLPVGIHIASTPEAVTQAKAAGFRDVLVDLPADGIGWQALLEALESAGMRYVLRIGSLAPGAEGVEVEPEGFRVAGLSDRRRITVKIPSGTSALTVLAAQSDGSVSMAARTPIVEDQLTFEAKPVEGIEHVALVYPILRSAVCPDYWEGFDQRRDELLMALRAAPQLTGLRGIVNPLGTIIRFPDFRTHFVPISPLFRLEFASYLTKRYSSVNTALRIWSVGASDIEGFDTLARLVPLWTESRGVQQLWDPATDKLYPCDSRKSRVWEDIQDAILLAARKRYERLVRAIREVRDVPVVQEWVGWSGPYEAVHGALDGIACRMRGSTLSAFVDSGSRAASSSFRRGGGWLIATDVSVPTDAAGEPMVSEALSEAASMGVRAWFFRPRTDAERALIAAEAKRIAGDTSYAQWKPVPLLYPESVTNPAAPQRITGGLWWLPAPDAGSRIDLGTKYSAYRMSSAGGDTYVLWSREPHVAKLQYTEPNSLTVTSADGREIKPRVRKGAIEVQVSHVPILISGTDDPPAPEEALREATQQVDQFLQALEKRKVPVDPERFAYRDILQHQNKSPGATLVALRAMLDSLYRRFGAYVWIEAESTRDTTFSEILQTPGCSGGGALALVTRIPTAAGYAANFDVPVRVDGDHEVWVAARLDEPERKRLQLTIGDVTLGIIEGPYSFYGLGFAWFKLGTAGLRAGQVSMRLQVDAPEGTELRVDAIVLSPTPFRPNGIQTPVADLPPIRP